MLNYPRPEREIVRLLRDGYPIERMIVPVTHFHIWHRSKRRFRKVEPSTVQSLWNKGYLKADGFDYRLMNEIGSPHPVI